MPALVYTTADGRIQRLVLNSFDVLANLQAGEAALYIDGRDNEDTIVEMLGDTGNLDTSRFKVQEGQLLRDSQPVILRNSNFLDRAKEFYQALPGAITFFANAESNWDTMTGAQKQAWLVNNFDTVLLAHTQQLRFLRWFIRETVRRFESGESSILIAE